MLRDGINEPGVQVSYICVLFGQNVSSIKKYCRFWPSSLRLHRTIAVIVIVTDVPGYTFEELMQCFIASELITTFIFVTLTIFGTTESFMFVNDSVISIIQG